MRSHRLALAELQRLTAAPMLRLAVLALILIPSLYAGLYLYAHRDPYAGMSRVPAAIVNEDQGTSLATGEWLQVGDEIVEELAGSGSFDWHRVTRAEAVRGVEAEAYDFAVVVPAGFSADLASVSTGDPRQAHLEQLTNDANGYLARTISNQIIAQITKSVSSKLSVTTASRFMDGLAGIRTQVRAASEAAAQLGTGSATLTAGQQQLSDASGQLADGVHQASAGANQLATGLGRLNTGLAQLDAASAQLPAQTAALAEGARQVSAGNAQLAQLGTQVAASAQRLRTARATLGPSVTAQLDAIAARNAAAATPDPQVTEAVAAARAGLATATTELAAADSQINATVAQVNQLSAGSAAVADGATRLATGATQLRSGIVAAHQGAAQADTGAAALATGLDRLDAGAAQVRDGQTQALAGTKRLADGGRQLGAGLEAGLKDIPASSEAQRRAAAQVMGAPIAIDKTATVEVENYGAGLAPFFLAASLWIGAYSLFLLVRPLSVRAIVANQPGWRVALGGWLAPAALAILQAVVAFLMVSKGLGVRVDRPWLVVAFLAGVSCVYAAILLALAARFGTVGKFVGLILMVVQLVSAGGTFPWQTLPGPLRVVHHLMPMSYVVEGLRHLMYGGSLQGLPRIVAVLLAYLVVALAATRWAALRLRIWTPDRIKPVLEL